VVASSSVIATTFLNVMGKNNKNGYLQVWSHLNMLDKIGTLGREM